MPIYSFYRIVKDIIRTIFGGKFWRKFLIIILISIAIWFILHDKGYCVDETEDINYQVQSYYDALVNDAIIRINKYIQTNGTDNVLYRAIIDNTNCFYFYYGNYDGTSYNNGRPIVNQNLYIAYRNRFTSNSATPSSNDYLGVTGFTMYSTNWSHFYFANDNFYNSTYYNTYFPLFVTTYTSSNWTNYITALINNDTQAIISLLNEIKEQNDTILEEMTQDVQDTSQGVVDTSIVDTSSTEQATQNVQSLLGIIKGFYDNIGDEVYTISFPIRNTSFSIRSDIISSHIRGTWLATFLNTFWYFIFGMYYLIFLFRIGKWLADGSLFEERRCS